MYGNCNICGKRYGSTGKIKNGKLEIYDSCVYVLLDEFRQKAGAWQSQKQAFTIYNKLKNLLPKEDLNKLFISWEHYRIGEGAGELYEVCNDLKVKVK